MKRQITEREKSFAKHTSNKGFVNRTYKKISVRKYIIQLKS